MSAIINTIYVFSLSGFIHYLKLNKKVNWVKSCFATCDKDELFLGKNVLNARITQEQFVEEMKKIKYDIVNIGLHFILKNVRPYAAPCSEA